MAPIQRSSRISSITSRARERPHSPPPPPPAPPPPGSSLDADALRRLLLSTRVTTVDNYLAKGRTIDDYRGAIWMYLDRYVKTGDLTALAKAILKTASLREHLAQH